MDVHLYAWLGLAAVVAVLIIVDIVGHVRTPHAPTLKEATWWSLAYVLLGLGFGLVVMWQWGSEYAGQYWAGFLTEKALSMDNLFVFIMVMGSFAIPREYQQKALLWGIMIALVLRLVFILLGAAIIEQFAWVFYIFGIVLFWTAIQQLKPEDHDEEPDFSQHWAVKGARRIFNVWDHFDGQNFFHRENGKFYITPMFLVVFVLGGIDLIFALDSIPAIFGLTKEPYLVFAANAFALLGLRQLFFLVDGLLERLVYLHYGLAAILGFISIKLVMHAMHTNNLPFINGGKHIDWVPEIGIAPSLTFIGVTIAITVVASLIKSASSSKN